MVDNRCGAVRTSCNVEEEIGRICVRYAAASAKDKGAPDEIPGRCLQMSGGLSLPLRFPAVAGVELT